MNSWIVIKLDNVFILAEGEVSQEASADLPVCDGDKADDISISTDRGR